MKTIKTISGTADLQLYQTLTYHCDLDKLSKEKSETGKLHAELVRHSENDEQLTIFHYDDYDTIRLTNLNKLEKSYNVGVKKCFTYIMSIVLKGGIIIDEIQKNNEIYYNEAVAFPITDLINIEAYASADSARRALKQALTALTTIQISGKKGKRTQYEQQTLFIGYRIKNGVCTMELNPHLNWSYFAQFYMELPLYYFKASSNTADLLFYICNLIRQKGEEIKEKGYFNLSLKAIRSFLGLPKKSINPMRDILSPIESAVKELNDACKSGEIEGLKIEPSYSTNSSVSEVINSGYIKIFVSGDMAKIPVQIAEHRTKKIKDEQKRKDKIEATAKAKALEKTMKKAADQMERSKAHE